MSVIFAVFILDKSSFGCMLQVEEKVGWMDQVKEMKEWK